MNNNPLAIVCIFFCLGIWAAKLVHIPLFFIYVSLILFLVSALASLKRRFIFFLSLWAVVFLAGFIHLEDSRTYPASHISHFLSDEPRKVYLIGRVASNPEVSRTFYHSKKSNFTFRVYDLKVDRSWQSAQGLIRTTVYGEREVKYGDELLLQGMLKRPPGLRNPGGFNYQTYLANHNIFGLLKVKEKDTFLSLQGDTSPIGFRNGLRLVLETVLRGVIGFKQRLHGMIYEHLEPEGAALLSAILLGERAAVSQDVKDLFINTGTIHILAISGLHVGLMAFILIALFRFFRLERRLIFILTIFLLIGYALLTGGRPSVVRATIMAVIVIFGFLINREIGIYNSLGLAALLILIFNPAYLFDSGFQLSFLSVISIVYFTPNIERLFPAKNHFLFYLTRAFSVSLAAWIGIAPLVAFYFNIVTPISIVANLIIVPCLFLVVTTGVTFLTFAYIWSGLGEIFSQSCWLVLSGLEKLTLFVSKIPFSFFRCPKPDTFFFLGYYAIVLFIFNYKRWGVKSGKAAIALALTANVLVWRPLFDSPSDRLTVTFLDVGYGDAIFIEFPCSAGTMLIDGGAGAGESDAGRWAILPLLWNKGINEIDALLLTHPDNDHLGGLSSVIRNVKVNCVFDNGMVGNSETYDNYRKIVAEKVPQYRSVECGEEIFGFPGVKITVLHPPEHFLTGTGTGTNNNSLVLKLTYKDVIFLFCADIQKEAMKRLLPYSSMLKATVLKVPHHGSDEGEAENYLFGRIMPQVAVISIDRNNRFGFPAPRVVEKLKQLGAQVYKTSDSGAVIISTDGKDVRVKTMGGLPHPSKCIQW